MSLNFKPLDCRTLLELGSVFRERPTLCCESHIAYHMIWNNYYKTCYHADEKGILWLQKIDYDERATMVPVCRVENMKENFQRLQNYFTEELGVKLHMYLVDSEALNAILPDPERYEVIEDRDSFDYIYDGDSIRTLRGRKYAKKKNMVTRFLRDYGAQSEFVHLSGADLEEIMDFAGRWFKLKESEDDLNRLDSEAEGLRDAVIWGEEASLAIGGVRVGGRLEAISISSYDPAKDMAAIHIEKANSQIRGLYNYLGMKHLQEFYPEARYINREDDMGFENLRRTKESMHPVLRGVKYSIIERP